MAADKFSEMNDVLSECVKEVRAKVAQYNARQERIKKDKTTATFSTLTEAQVLTMANDAIAARRSGIQEAAAASIVGAIFAASEK